MTLELWPHQLRAVADTLAAINEGHRRICLTSPTGGGKTQIACELIRHYLGQGKRVVLYTNRRLLTDQLSGKLEGARLYHGVRAAGHEHRLDEALQVASIQTEGSRVLRRGQWELHEADLAIVDEAHIQTGRTARTILEMHVNEGAACVGLTATPIDLASVYDHLIVAGTNSELRACGALVWANHFGPDEPDLRRAGKLTPGFDLTENQAIAAIMVPGVFGRVWEWFTRLNSERRPTILFAPGVKASLWFAEQFLEKGVPAAHVSGEEVWINGQSQPTSAEARQEVADASRSGDVVVVCNRFVCREGIDWPHLEHAIFATVFGSLQSYLQSGGRLLRACPGVQSVTVQDHGGNWHRHGSLNADRHWELGLTSGIIAGMREEGLRAKKCRRCKAKLTPGCASCQSCGASNEPEPFLCPKCHRVLIGTKCPCGFIVDPGAKSRPVVHTDGSLTELTGDIYKPRRLTKRPDAAKVWERMYYRARNANMTFRQAEALFAYENHWGWPPRTLPLMPRDERDFYRKVGDVPAERLTREE
jgi:superfamily II DNA or RNA helicase